MKLEIKAGSISQIKQISKCLPEDLLSSAVLSGEPLLDYLRNILIFSGKKKTSPIKCLNKMFMLNKINAGQISGSKERILAGLEYSKNEAPFEIRLDKARLASFSDYYAALAFLKNLNPDSPSHADLVFCTKRVRAAKLMNFDPEWLIAYAGDEGCIKASIFSAESPDDIISADWEGEYISVWNLRRNIFAGSFNEEIRKYWTNALDCRGLIYNKNMTEPGASSENAFKLYNLLNKGERKHIKANGILPDKIKEKYLRFYLNNICGRTSLYFDEAMFRNIKPDEQRIITNENDKCPGYIQNIPEHNAKYYIFIEKKLLLTVNLWSEADKFISRLDKSIMDSARISHHPNWNGICWNSIKDEKCHMLIYGDDEILFKSEGSSIPRALE